MLLTYDTAKNARNVAERGLSFDLVGDLDWDTAAISEDVRKDYGERRMRAVAMLNGRLHVAIITYRGDIMHVISFRKANRREIRRYEEEGRRSRVGA